MWTSDNLENDSRRCIEALLRAVPASSRRILDVGCGDAQFGARLKEADGSREVFGIACGPASVDGARQRLDQVYTLDIQTQDPPIEPGTLDCIIYAGVLEHLIDPQEVLRRHRSLLKPQGVILCCIPNVQHHSLLAALLKGDVQSTSEGLREPAHLRFFTYFTFFKLLLDAGFTPSIADTTNAPCPKPLFDAIEPLLHYLGVDWGRMQRYLGTYQYIFRGMPLPYYNRSALAENGSGAKTCLDEPPLSFVVCVSNDATLKGNLLSSPCLAQGSAHELLLMRGCRSAAEGLNRGLARARHPLVVCVHQDVYLPWGWPARFWEQYCLAQELYGNLGVLGVYGVSFRNGGVIKTGKVIDRDHLLEAGGTFPAPVDTLDELLVAVRKDAPLQFDPQLGFHFYGADICLAARKQGLSAMAVDALCFHNSPHAGLPPEFFASARAFAAKWNRQWPVATSCALIDQHGTIHAP